MRSDVKLSLASGVIAAVVMVAALPQSSKECNWHSHIDVQTRTSISVNEQARTCDDNVTEVSWYSWLAGKSASYQFHFLDLLELLYSRDNRGGNLGTHSN